MPDATVTLPAAQDQVQQLLSSVRAIAPVLIAGAEAADAHGRLPDESVDALMRHGLWRMRLPRELGGLETSICTQIRVLSALAEVDTSSAWCTMVANHAVAVIGTTMPDRALRRIFADGVPACTIVAATEGTAVPVDGGYLVSGTWRLASAIRHAKWIHASASVNGNRSRRLPFAIPVAAVNINDSWHVTGLRATGSADFSVQNCFIPQELTGVESAVSPQVRGLRRYDFGEIMALDSYEHLAFAIGVGRRALTASVDVLVERARTKKTEDREMVQEQLGKLTLQLDAVEALAYSYFGRVDITSQDPSISLEPADRHKARALAVWATQVALGCVRMAFQRAGAGSLYVPNVFEKLLRDMSVASTHILVDDAALAAHGRSILESAQTRPREGALDNAR